MLVNQMATRDAAAASRFFVACERAPMDKTYRVAFADVAHLFSPNDDYDWCEFIPDAQGLDAPPGSSLAESARRIGASERAVSAKRRTAAREVAYHAARHLDG